MSAREYLSLFTPNGSQTRSKAGLFTHPRVVNRVLMGKAYDVTGLAYVDWISGLAAVGLGAGYPEVDEAVVKQIRDYGVTFPLPTLQEGETAELLCSALGWPQQVRWVKTGSEATDGALLIAREYTKRRKVVSVGYHGWHLAHLPGPETVCLPIHSLHVFDAVDGDTAAVIVEPMRDEVGDHGEYLRQVQDLCREVGALFIMDEIVTGFRWALGGACEYFGLVPDLACYGKALANGFPLAAIVGHRRIMDRCAWGVSSTFGGEGIGLAACRAGVEVYRREPVIRTLWERGEQLMRGVPDLEGYAVHPHWPARWSDEQKQQRSQKAADRGVLFHPAGGNPQYCHTEEDVKLSIEALQP